MKSLASYYFLYYLGQAALMPYLSLYLSDKGISSTLIGLLLSLWAFTSVIAQPIMGMLNDRLNDRRQILMLCTILSPILAFGFYFFDAYFALLIFSVLFPWFQSSSASLSDALAVEIGSHAGISFGSIRLWGALSFSLASFVTGIVYERSGYGSSFFYFLIINAAVLGVLFLFPKIKPSEHKLSMFDQAKEVISHKRFLGFIGICLLVNLSIAINFSFLPIYFKEMGFNKAWIGTTYAIAAIIEVPMFWVSAKMNDKIGRLPVLCMAAICYAAKCLTLAFTHDIYLVLASQLLDGMAYAFFASASVEMVKSYSKDETQATFQTVFAAITTGLGGIIGGAFGGIFIDQMGAPFLYFILFALCMTAAVLFIISNKMSNRSIKQDWQKKSQL
ncbi:MFS transporter [Paenibacillus frigoriresistens]|uniref:MFS transporter n=1 Tax=Paenibacillus alginolyticus TaxID=59839 RepID=UPI0015638176|nr:MFS transporter [Paenibacillus frigoriresistens]NRF90121.1 MFS transporter [Paenibacillus frigoriresistens]